MLKPRKYSFGVLLDNLWIGLTLAAIWGAVVVIIGAILFWRQRVRPDRPE